jgi:density-regulated protein
MMGHGELVSKFQKQLTPVIFHSSIQKYSFEMSSDQKELQHDHDDSKTVIYCDICTAPPEYCMYFATPDKCKTWLKGTHPDMYLRIYGDDGSQSINKDDDKEPVNQSMQKMTMDDEDGREGDQEHKHHGRGGKSLHRDPAVKAEKEAKKRASARVQIRRTSRTKRKTITSIRGLEVFGVDQKGLAKTMASKFACGASVAEVPGNQGEEIVVQGDFVDEVMAMLLKTIPEVSSFTDFIFLSWLRIESM